MAKNKSFSATIENKKQAETYYNKTLSNIDRFAISGTANTVAFEGIKKSNAQFKKSFTLSNNFLTGTAPGKGVLKYNKAKPSHDLNKIESSWGAPEKRGQTSLDFLVDQEDGFTHKGMVPTKNAYPGQNKDRVIKKNLRRQNIQIQGTRGYPRGIAKTNFQRTLFFLRKMYLSRFAMPGSKQFIYLKSSDEYLGFSEGMYQFTSNKPFGEYGNFPKMRMIYATTDKVNKKRKAKHVFEKVHLQFTETEIGKIFEKEFDRAFTNQIKRLR